MPRQNEWVFCETRILSALVVLTSVLLIVSRGDCPKTYVAKFDIPSFFWTLLGRLPVHTKRRCSGDNEA